MKNKKIILMLVMFSVLTLAIFAAGDSAIVQLDEWGERIVSLFTSTWLKAVCIIALIGIAIGMITAGRNEPGMIKKFIPWLIGTIVLLSATGIVGYFFDGANFSITSIPCSGTYLLI